jgi:hypothetical protein
MVRQAQPSTPGFRSELILRVYVLPLLPRISPHSNPRGFEGLKKARIHWLLNLVCPVDIKRNYLVFWYPISDFIILVYPIIRITPYYPAFPRIQIREGLTKARIYWLLNLVCPVEIKRNYLVFWYPISDFIILVYPIIRTDDLRPTSCA